MRTSSLLSCSVLVSMAALAMAQAPAPTLTIDQLVKIKHPAGHQWTPDGSRVWFTYDDGGVNNIWAVPADGSSQPVALTAYPDGQTGAGGFWSRDGRTFFFQRDGGLLAVSESGGTPRAAWPSAARASGFVLSPDGTRVAFIVGQAAGAGAGGRGGRGGGGGTTEARAGNATMGAPAASGADLIVHTIATDSDQRQSHVDGRIGAASWSPDSSRLAYTTSSGGGGGRRGAPDAGAAGGGAAAAAVASDLVVADVVKGTGAAIAHENGPIGAPSWSPDGSSLVYTTGSGGAPIQHLVSPPEVGAKLIFVSTEGGRGGGGESFVVPSSGGAPHVLTAVGRAGGGGRGGGGGNWLDATHLLATRTSSNGKTRTAEAVDINAGDSEPKVLHEETEEKFFSAVNTTNAAISPDHRWLLYTTDATGWDQIYVMPTSGGAPTQVSKTLGDHWRAVWSHDSRRIAWDTDTADKPGDRQIEIATIADDPARATIVSVTSGNGTNTAPQWSPDDRRLLYQHTDAENSADLYVADAAANAKPTRLTSSMPASIDHSIFVAPQLVHYPGPDGKPVPAWLFVPKNLDRTKRHPAIVWIHPDGVNQNYDGFHTDRNEGVYYEFHQYLLQQGYVVIAPDYRGSIGYGRDWRNDVYMDVGGNDAKDARMAYGHLKTLGFVDADRVGVWGLSYGGFFTLLAVTQEPTWFRAAVDVAGVTDYALYYEDPYHGGWTTSRIGTPEEHPDVYAKADPMAHVDQIQHPLLVLAGTADVNVPFIESALLIDHLLKAGKGDLTTFMMYPGEFHYFDRSFVVRDAWRRVDAFFRENLHPERATPK
jgi:dipeptidyl aminopeptidase/acylaminoacyl peptidase